MSETANEAGTSGLWISLSEAVERTGVSPKSLMAWVQEGHIKKERRKGTVYLWIHDLVKKTPLQGAANLNPPAEILPMESLPSSPSAVGRQLADQLRLALDNQDKILARLNQTQNTHLDEKTAKELSLLGNVFRSIHQQNEKLNLTLATQEQRLKDLLEDQRHADDLKQELGEQKRKLSLTRWGSAALCFGILFSVALTSWLVYAQVQDNKREQESHLRSVRTLQEQQLKDLAKANAEFLQSIEQSHQQEKAQKDKDKKESLERLEKDLTTLYNERLDNLQRGKAAETQQLTEIIRKLEEKHQEELQQLEMDKAKLQESQSKSIDQLDANFQQLKTWMENSLLLPNPPQVGSGNADVVTPRPTTEP